MVVKMNVMHNTVKDVHKKSKEMLPYYKKGNPILGPYRYKKSKSTYKGQYKEGKRDGFGVEIWPDGTIYEGKNLNN